ncbi:S-layer homology domain-containing protein [Paenibacillus paeoniae]|nr:S-layer homology domain-containing protein [Paenibacillus paeoniae]
MVKLKKIFTVVLALAVFINVYSGVAKAQGTAILKISTNAMDSTYGEDVTFNVTALDPVIGGTTPSGTVTFRDGNQDLMTVGLTTAEPVITRTNCGSACPLIQWGAYTFRAFSFGDNRIAMNIVTYDASGKIVNQLEKAGARYLSNITMDAAAQTFTLWGQDDMTITVGWGELLSASSSASFKTSALEIGMHAITAAFPGDDAHAASEATTTFTVHPRYTVVYNGNGSTGGEVPANSGSYNGIKVSISGNNGNLVKTGYTFAGWNTQADGYGVDYTADAEGVVTSDVTLYAKWSKTLDVGTGTESDPYQITTGEELDTVRNYLGWNLYFKLMADIDLSSYGQGWLPIGGPSGRFQGHMDGNGHKITGLTINRPNDNFSGLFGYIDYDASVSNMILENVNVTGKQFVGGLVGRIDGGEISNSYVSGSVTGTGASVGGLIGYNYYGTVSNSIAKANVTGSSTNVGGMVGANFGEISYGYAAGNVTGTGTNVGGLIGTNSGEISYSYAAGSVTGSGIRVGGLIGNNSSGTISYSFYDSGTTGQSDTGKGDGRTTTEMKTQSTFTDSDWDFTSIWGISPLRNNGYPYLQAIQKYVTYDGNGNTGGSVPTDSKSYSQGETVNVYSNTVTLLKTDYTFAGWNTQADGSGTDYASGASFSMGSSDVILYAKWESNSRYTVTYNGNGSTGGIVPTDSNSYKKGETVSVYGNNGNLVKTGYTFAGWNTAADGSGMSYDKGTNFPIGTQNVTLYARWLSTNTLLSGLSVDQGTLNFSPWQTNYAVDVENSVASLNLLISKGDPNQSLTVTGATYGSVADDVYSYNVSNLVVGPNPIQIAVTAQDGTNTAYVVTVTRKYLMGEPVQLDPSVRTLKYSGGLTIKLPDELLIPEGATLTVQDSNNAPSGEVKLARAGQVIDFQFEGITIDQPIEITLGYDGNADPSKLAIYYYNITTGEWEYNPSQITDSGIKTTVSHFSTYGVLADTTAPDQVTVTMGAKTANSITLHLAANDDSGVAKYLIYRDGTLIAETAESTYVDTGLSASKTYTYTAKAVDRLGNISNTSKNLTVATSGDGRGSAPATPPSDKVTSSDGKLTLPVGSSGEVSLGDGIKIIIPAMATGKELNLTIDKVTDIQTLITNKDVLLSSVFEVLKNFAENFEKPVTLSFKFDPTGLKSNEKPVVFYYDEVKKEWVKIGGTVSGNIISVDVNHFTKYAVLAVADAALPATDGSFSDITGHWAEASIKQAVSVGIVSGYPDGTFKPGRTVTRAEFAVMLMNALKPQGEGASLTFTDKAKIGSWAQKSVAQAVYAGVINGYKDGSFRPNEEITRAEMAKMVAKALGLTGEITETHDFADDKDIPDWAKGAVATIKNLGIIEGKGANQFAPGDKTTRAEAVTVLLKMLEQKSK